MRWLWKLYSPDNPAEAPGGEVKEVPPKEDPPKEDPPKEELVDNEPKTFNIMGKDGKNRVLTEEQLYMVAQEGIQVFADKQKVIDEEEAKPKPANEELQNLREKVAQMELDRKTDKEKLAIKQALVEEADKYTLTKVGPKTRSLIENTALLAAHSQKLTIDKAYAHAAKQYEDALAEYAVHTEANKDANNRVKATIAGGQMGAGGIPTVESVKPATPEDVKSGKSRDAISEILGDMWSQ